MCITPFPLPPTWKTHWVFQVGGSEEGGLVAKMLFLGSIWFYVFKSSGFPKKTRKVAQSVERRISNPKVASSSLVSSVDT